MPLSGATSSHDRPAGTTAIGPSSEIDRNSACAPNCGLAELALPGREPHHRRADGLDHPGELVAENRRPWPKTPVSPTRSR
jgi:hypothetical protein